MLTSRQRLLRLFHGGDIDRIPIWLLAPYHRLDYYAPIYQLKCYQPLTRLIHDSCDTFDRRRPSVGFAYNAHPDIRQTSFTEGLQTGTRVTCKQDVLEAYISKEGGRTSRRFYVREPKQLLQILQWPYQPVRPAVDVYQKEKQELGEAGLLMMDLGDPLEPLYHLCDASDFSMWTLTDLDTLLRFTDVMSERVLDLYRYFLDQDIADAYFIVGAEFAGPPLVSPALFGQLCKRYVKAIVTLIQSYSKIAIIHYHGNLYHLLDGFADIAPNGLHTVEAPPTGDCTIAQARSVLGAQTTLIGNIQYDDLVHKQPHEIRELVRTAVLEGKDGKFILSPTAGPYETNPSPQTIDNYIAMVEAGLEFGRYV
ncbi:MAG: hypothetical protein IH607_05250 [Firmicutes bacterium]|nr:hypothetical protein [Bacillota bacterium]